MDTLVGILMHSMKFMEVWCRSEEFVRKNVVRVLSGEGTMCVKCMA